jgi:hypothetical protein
VAPYARFVRVEEERWIGARTELTALRDRAADFQTEIGISTLAAAAPHGSREPL